MVENVHYDLNDGHDNSTTLPLTAQDSSKLGTRLLRHWNTAGVCLPRNGAGDDVVRGPSVLASTERHGPWLCVDWRVGVRLGRCTGVICELAVNVPFVDLNHASTLWVAETDRSSRY